MRFRPSAHVVIVPLAALGVVLGAAAGWSADSDTEEPDTEEPDTEEPDTEEPDTEEPDTEEPDTEEPDTEEPDTEEPDTEEPDTEEPDTEEPDTEEPDTEEPDTEEPDTEEPDTEEPDTEEPDTEEPDTEDILEGSLGSRTVEVLDERLCGLSDDSSLKAQATETAHGHWSHEDWIAKESSQVEVSQIHQALNASLGSTGSMVETPENTTLASRLSNGIVGVTADNVTQRFIVVVDPSVVSLDTVSEALATVAGELRIQIRPSCRSIAQLAAADDTLRDRQWHPSASESSYGYYMDPATATFKVTFASNDNEAAESLKSTLGDNVTITYGTPSRLGPASSL